MTKNYNIRFLLANDCQQYARRYFVGTWTRGFSICRVNLPENMKKNSRRFAEYRAQWVQPWVLHENAVSVSVNTYSRKRVCVACV